MGYWVADVIFAGFVLILAAWLVLMFKLKRMTWEGDGVDWDRADAKKYANIIANGIEAQVVAEKRAAALEVLLDRARPPLLALRSNGNGQAREYLDRLISDINQAVPREPGFNVEDVLPIWRGLH